MLHASGTRGEWVQCCSFFEEKKRCNAWQVGNTFFSRKKNPHIAFLGDRWFQMTPKKISFFLQASFLSLFSSSSEYPKTTTFLELDDRQAWKRTSLSKAYAPSFHIFSTIAVFLLGTHKGIHWMCDSFELYNMCVNWDIETRLFPAKWNFQSILPNAPIDIVLERNILITECNGVWPFLLKWRCDCAVRPSNHRFFLCWEFVCKNCCIICFGILFFREK